ncbi:hypothetical protein DQ04_03321030 [Trypanosoma grayi]|uniref:hypothetical protein n=1 Tax=Trypanosoma grayi TaxID=71804 RepID=UPI0004F4570A|nr:hypothetical protein DQ04_03321030 [Trypanosoma grayi]KEG10763.1 hypothetical protein DQ04_03321030 [Trypanosoma grayi]
MGQTRTFVFITNIPDFLLEPLSINATAAGPRARANRDPRYERLRALLAANTSGVMLVMHLETRGYGLALYASEPEALAACKATIVPAQPGHQHPPLLLRILQRERPPPTEAVYTPTLTVEGDVVQKAELADTRGLELVYRGRAVPRWCPHTAAQEDCPFGTACHRIHKRAFQRTVRKRPRVEEVVTAAVRMTEEERRLVRRITCSTRLTEERLVPPEMRFDFSVYVPITKEQALALVGNTPDTAAVTAAVVQRVEAACEGRCGPYFVKFALPGGAPWDWSLYDAAVGLPQLRQRAPFPDNGAPTPLERDLFCQQMLYHLNQMNRFDTVAAAIHALAMSPRAREALMRQLQGEGGVAGADNEVEQGSVNAVTGSATLELCVRPWLALPTADMEVSVLLENGGEKLRGVLQRHSALRLMTSATFLQQHNMDFTRYAVLGRGEDTEAEECLENELRHVTAVVKRGVDTLRQYLRQRTAQQQLQLPPGAGWCVQLALTPPPSSSSSSSSSSGGEHAAPRCLVLSLRPYQQALEEFTAVYGALRSDGGGAEVTWNTKKHPYVSLFPRELMERLAPEQQQQ